MKTPFTVDQFLDVFKNYNEGVFPMQIIFYFIGTLAIVLAVKPTKGSGRIISAILSIFWLWMGIVYHIMFFSVINPVAVGFGIIFILQSALLLFFGVVKNEMIFKFHPDIFGITGLAMIAFALIIYPVLGYFNGHIYPSSPTFGLPCPTTIFTLSFLLMSERKFPVVILIIPVLWSIIGFTAAFRFGIIEDTGLIIAGLLALFMILCRNRKISLNKIQTVSYGK